MSVHEPTSTPAPTTAAQGLHFDPKKRTSLSAPRRVKVVFDRARFTQDALDGVRTCPHCGVAPSSRDVKKRKYIYYPKLLLLLIPAGWLFVLIAYLLTRQVVELRLPLCTSCNSRDKTGRMTRGFALLSVLFFPFFAVMAAIVLNLDGASFGGLVASSFFAGIAASVVATKRTRDDIFEPSLINKTEVKVELPESWPAVLRDEAPTIAHRVLLK